MHQRTQRYSTEKKKLKLLQLKGITTVISIALPFRVHTIYVLSSKKCQKVKINYKLQI